jgi:biopolymer transport protein ExbB
MSSLLVFVLLAAAQVSPPITAEPAPVKNAADSKKSAAAANETAAKDDAKKVDEKKPAGKDEVKEKAWYETGALGYMFEGGPFMWPILASGILALGVMIERYRSLNMLAADTEGLRHKVLDLLQEDRVEEALTLCDSEQGPIPAILTAGLRKFLVLKRLNYDPGKIEEQVVKAMDDYGVHIVAALERHLPILATVSSVAPMLGFLGTVQGMVISFRDIVDKKGDGDIVMAAAGGIMVALLTTVLGLMVGIPAFTAYNYFTSVINRFVLSIEESATELIEAVTLQMALIAQEKGQDTSVNGSSHVPIPDAERV